MVEKKCGKCQLVLPIENFGKDKQNSHGYKNNCKECRKARASKHYLDNADRIKAVTSAYQRANPEATRAKVKRHRDRHPETASRAWSKRRAVLAKIEYVEPVDVVILGDRDKWICQLCFEPVNKELRGRTSKSRSIDHIIPVSSGGEHSYANTQLAHFGCNSRKRNTT